jgi:branched-chain amino acid transport system substrate-binding protein
MPKRRDTARLLTLLAATALMAAACGGDGGNDSAAPTTAPAVTETTAAGAAGATNTSAGGDATATCGGELDASLDEKFGVNAGQMAQFIACAQERPLKADESLEPFVIGLENSQGDPSFTFPDITGGMQAAVDYINDKLGGIGSDPLTGTAGRPVKLETCFIGLDPADSVRCANELAAKKPAVVIQGFNNNSAGTYPVLAAAGVVNISGVPVNQADYNAQGVFAPAPGGGCVGAHPALVDFAVKELGARRVAVAWFDIPNGRICYHDLEKKPLNILQGSAPGPEGVEGTVPDLQHTQVPIPPAAPDLSTQATQLLDFKPDAILYSAPVGSCVSLVNALAGLGWSPETAPAVFTGACFEQKQIEELGDKADGMYFVGAKDASNPDSYEEGLLKIESQEFVAAMKEYAPDVSVTSFASAIFQDTLLLWHVLANAAAETGPDGLDKATIEGAIGSTVNHHMWAASPASCGEPVESYASICNTLNSALKWDAAAKTRTVVKEDFDGAYLVAGTELDPEISG